MARFPDLPKKKNYFTLLAKLLQKDAPAAELHIAYSRIFGVARQSKLNPAPEKNKR